MNITLLKKIKNAILKAPLRFNMDWWVEKHDPYYDAIPLPPCRTTACIAGHALVIDQKKPLTTSFWRKQKPILGDGANNSATSIEAGKLLDLNSEQRGRLFFEENWPERFRLNAYPHNKREVTRNAKLAARRIDHFIETRGEE